MKTTAGARPTLISLSTCSPAKPLNSAKIQEAQVQGMLLCRSLSVHEHNSKARNQLACQLYSCKSCTRLAKGRPGQTAPACTAHVTQPACQNWPECTTATQGDMHTKQHENQQPSLSTLHHPTLEHPTLNATGHCRHSQSPPKSTLWVAGPQTLRSSTGIATNCRLPLSAPRGSSLRSAHGNPSPS